MPKENVGVVVLTNRFSAPVAEIVTQRVYDRALQLPLIDWSRRHREAASHIEQSTSPLQVRRSRRKPNTSPSHALSCYEGHYEHQAYGQLRVVPEGDGLRVIFHDLSMTLIHFHYDVFELEYGPLGLILPATFHTNVFGDIDSVTLQMEGSSSNHRFRSNMGV